MCATAERLRGLRRLAVCVAIDGVGTWYTSLSYQPDLPQDILKSDKSFLEGPEQTESPLTLGCGLA